MQSLSFTLPFALPSLNTRLRTHWAKARREQSDLAWEVTLAMGGPFFRPENAFQKARVTIVRHSAGTLDTDGLYGSCKPLLDVMCVLSKRHPCGLGFIEDDAPDKCELIVTQDKAPRGKGKTIVRVERLA